MRWRIEDKVGGKGHRYDGSLGEACRNAQAQCQNEFHRWCVWDRNTKVAEVSREGVYWMLPAAPVKYREKRVCGGCREIVQVNVSLDGGEWCPECQHQITEPA